MSLSLRTVALPTRRWFGARRGARGDRSILAAQIAAVLIVVLYEASELAGVPWPLQSQEFAPIALFLIPVLYVVRGMRPVAALALAAWALLLVTLDVELERQGLGRWADGVQVAIIGTVALFVGARVQHERRIRQRVEDTREALRVSEARYRALFEQSQTPALVVRADGVVREANAAATALFASPARPVAGRSLADLVGPTVAHQLLTGSPPEALEHPTAGGALILRPRCTALLDASGSAGWQIVLQDITEERRRRRRADAYAAHVLRGQEEERRRIAHELHDDPVQSLIHVCRRLDLVPRRDALPADTVAALEETRRLAEQVAQRLRELARGLRPPSLDDLGLVASLRQLVRQFVDRTGVEAAFEVRGTERRLDPDVELALFRIAQEALRNVERHAAARHVVVRLAFCREARLSIRDDGIGFRDDGIGFRALPATFQGVGNGLGLLGMQERAALAGGRLGLRAAEGAGTTVRVAIPAAVPRREGTADAVAPEPPRPTAPNRHGA